MRLLDLPAEIQEMIINGSLPPSNILALQRGKKRGRKTASEKEKADLLQLAIARKLVDELERETETVDEEGKGGKKLTLKTLKKAKREALVSLGRGVEAQQLETHTSLYAVLAGAAKIVNHAQVLLEDPAAFTEALRTRGEGKPAETVRDTVQIAIEKLQELLAPIATAINPPAPEILEGRPSYTEFIRQTRRIAFGNAVRYNIAQALAEATDKDGRVLTIQDLAEVLGEDTHTINGNMQTVTEELSRLGLTFFRWEIRKKDVRGNYSKYPAYRLTWKAEPDVVRKIEGTRLPVTEKEVECLRESTTVTASTAEGTNGDTLSASTIDFFPGTSFPRHYKDLTEDMEKRLYVDCPNLLLVHYAAQAQQDGIWAKVIIFQQMLLDKDNKPMPGLVFLAKALEKTGRLEEALEARKQITSLEPHNPINKKEETRLRALLEKHHA